MRCFQIPSLKAEGSPRKRRWKDCKIQRKWLTPRKQWCTYEIRDHDNMHKKWTGLHQSNSHHWEGEVDRDSHSWPRNYLQLMSDDNRKANFLQWSITGYINHSRIGPKGPMPKSSWLTQNGLHVFWFVLRGCIIGFCCSYLVLFSFLEGERSWSFIGRLVGRILEEVKEKTWLKYTEQKK